MASIGPVPALRHIGFLHGYSGDHGMVALPEMKRFKYDDALATGCVAAGGTLGF